METYIANQVKVYGDRLQQQVNEALLQIDSAQRGAVDALHKVARDTCESVTVEVGVLTANQVAMRSEMYAELETVRGMVITGDQGNRENQALESQRIFGMFEHLDTNFQRFQSDLANFDSRVISLENMGLPKVD